MFKDLKTKLFTMFVTTLTKINKIRFTAKVMISGLTVIMAVAMVMSPQAAQARLDELLRSDAPYLAAPVEEQPQQTAVGTAAPRVYIVREGDTMGEIACKNNVDMSKLVSMNNLKDSDHIIKGQVLMLPGTSFPYQVKKGESLSLIASRFGVGERELTAMNGLRNPDRVMAGQVLTIPAGQGGGETVVSRSLPLNQLEWPVVGWISSPYGMRDGAMHEGLDIAADNGQIVRAVKAGTVVFSGPRGTYGNTVIIDHGNGLRTLYAHNSKLLVNSGQKVLASQPIARIGSTGRSTGPHLHLEVLLNGVPFDPLLCLKRTYA
ncbi:Murein DD-endopeptidase MepM and murein hydrolase activator NlpD, contain LysM domain [Desulfotomaculum arcticum]|uniref:Murein DD-endopeptidase MepM and murein hydrolase activator NlpD, contain LysM domain n=1 Tax=Desulfotruncus arcticus DSM 17038 TaxID=1121424 RepID=A0A1I2VDT8_9FIRM|nr:M23 family metallopeptidase [Desulfotruncus arcticus]SFG87372.1 Murein DD-endopeptidase MepM and murein hydrolase activator NlpD, contain LysM domain [Desulfotomaculum arcticum] [Desulfotruncus arcticus DSM 17038]